MIARVAAATLKTTMKSRNVAEELKIVQGKFINIHFQIHIKHSNKQQQQEKKSTDRSKQHF